MGHGARGGRVGLLAVAVGGVGGAREEDWDVGMFRPGGSMSPHRSTVSASLHQYRPPIGDEGGG
jgi:hypothetical protein